MAVFYKKHCKKVSFNVIDMTQGWHYMTICHFCWLVHQKVRSSFLAQYNIRCKKIGKKWNN